MKKKNILTKVLEELNKQKIPVKKIYMNQQSKNLFTSGNEEVEIVIDNELPVKKFVYVKPGEEYDPNKNYHEYMVRVGNTDLFKEHLFSHKREDMPGI